MRSRLYERIHHSVTQYSLLSTQYSSFVSHHFSFHVRASVRPPAFAQFFSIERTPSAIAQVLNFVFHGGSDQPLGLSAREAFSHLFEVWNFKVPANSCPDFSILDDV